MPFPFALMATFGEQNQIVDRLSNGNHRPYLEDSWHRLTGSNSFKRVLRQRRDIVRDDDAPLVGGPLQN